jgi:integrase
MRRQGYRPSTIQAAISTLKALAKHANLLNPDTVKAHLASRNVSLARKEKICVDLARFYKFRGIPFQTPRYHRIGTIPFVPQERGVDQLISAYGKKTATFLQLLKETGMRPGEAWALRWKDLDFERACVTITPEKGSSARAEAGIRQSVSCEWHGHSIARMKERVGLTSGFDKAFSESVKEPSLARSQNIL